MTDGAWRGVADVDNLSDRFGIAFRTHTHGRAISAPGEKHDDGRFMARLQIVFFAFDLGMKEDEDEEDEDEDGWLDRRSCSALC